MENMNWKDAFLRLPQVVQEYLLTDRTVRWREGERSRIIWATDGYAESGEAYGAKKEITVAALIAPYAPVIRPMAEKREEEKKERVKKRAEVFTPSWVCNLQNNLVDDAWLGRPNAFNTAADGMHTWTRTEEPVPFPEKGRTSWRHYVDRKVLEITCGEAPYLVSRYDTVTGAPIPLEDRIGMLDRKLRVVGEHTETEADWRIWAQRAVEATYGYEYQGDSLLLARMNVFQTYLEYRNALWESQPDVEELRTIARIISWNLWQMDGLSRYLPVGSLSGQLYTTSLFGNHPEMPENDVTQIQSRIHNWRSKDTYAFAELGNEFLGGKTMKFDVVIGNPPYQEELEGTSDKPIYNDFMDASYTVADKVMLISPARFLFNAGKTPKAWNEKMLKDPHLKVMWYEQDSSKVFVNTDIKGGGVTITYRDGKEDFGEIGVFSSFKQLRTITDKVKSKSDSFIDKIIYSSDSYKFTKEIHKDFPEIKNKLSKGHMFDLATSVFDKLYGIVFWDKCPQDGEKYIRLIGRFQGQRKLLFVRKKYIAEHPNLNFFKVILPKSNGSGAFGEALSMPLIAEPQVGHTQTFISIGKFSDKAEATALLKYIKCKFTRALLGILKITQHNTQKTWRYVPLQDFTSHSDIDWSQSIHDIDQQLYKKYGLSQEEISFIESKVKEMK